jgi:hypothetical protein
MRLDGLHGVQAHVLLILQELQLLRIAEPVIALKIYALAGGVDYIEQTFAATITHVYNISFWTQRVQIGAPIGVTLYVGII